MKILMINKFLYPNGGSETYIFKLGDHLRIQGHEVEYFGMEHEKRCVGNSVHAYTKNMDFHGGSLLEKLSYPLCTIYSVEARKKIRRVLDSFQPDICHLNNFNYQLTPSILLEIKKWSRQTGKRCRIVYTAHDYQLLCPNHSFKNPVTCQICEKCLNGHFIHCLRGKCIHASSVRSLIGAAEAYFWKLIGVYRHIDAIICCSEFMKQKMDTNPLFSRKTIAMHNFIDCTASLAAEKKDYVLYFGRYSQEKGISTLVDACRKLPHIPFIFAGSGPLEGLLEGVPNIRNMGFQSGDALQTLIREARFSIYPSEWYENCPFSVMESQLMGTPVIGANIGGIPELIQNRTSGELFESGNCADLCCKIEMLWSNPGLQAAYSKKCRNLDFPNVEAYSSALMRIYGQN